MNNTVFGWKAVIGSGLAAAILGSGIALAETGKPAAEGQAIQEVLVLAQANQGATSSYLSIEQVVSKLEAQGFRVHGIELDDGRYEVEALDTSNNQVELKVDPETGDILYQEFDD